MIVAFQSQSHEVPVDYSCNGKEIHIDSRDATRSVLYSILDTAFGISPSHTRWSVYHQSEITNYLWSVSHSPAAIFSDSNEISFAVSDNSARHSLYTHIDQTLQELNYVLRHFENHGRELSEILTTNEDIFFTRRWNVLQYKVEEARNYLSHFEYGLAFEFARSMRHDTKALHEMVHIAGDRLQVVFSCRNQETSALTMAFDIYTKTIIIASPFVLILWVLIQKSKKNFEQNKAKRS